MEQVRIKNETSKQIKKIMKIKRQTEKRIKDKESISGASCRSPHLLASHKDFPSPSFLGSSLI
jgi:hypothetical protein